MDIELKAGETLTVRVPEADSIVTVEYGLKDGNERLRIAAETPDPRVSPNHRTIRGMTIRFRKGSNSDE